MVVMKGVSKTYNGKTVLHETTVSVKKGQLTSLIGPNGARQKYAFVHHEPPDST